MIDLSILQCPACRHSLKRQESLLRCDQCHTEYPLRGDVPVFVPEATQNVVGAHRGKTFAFKRIVKLLQAPHHSVYFSNLSPSYGEGKELKQYLRDHPDLTILNIGSLSGDLRTLHPHIWNLDIVHYPSVDIVADAHHLPFRDGSLDMILFKNVLEHIRDPALAMSEIHRVLKPGGVLYIKLPFLQPFHAVPDDYQRYTVSGMAELMQHYEQLDFGIAVGPGSMMSWMLREYLAILTSFGSMKAYKAGLIAWGWLTFWIKYTDLLFRRNQLAERVTSAFWGMYKKK